MCIVITSYSIHYTKLYDSNIEANFYLPPSLNPNEIDLSTYTGRYGSHTSQARTQWLSTSHIQVHIASLAPHEGATVELAYPFGKLEQNGIQNVAPSLFV